MDAYTIRIPRRTIRMMTMLLVGYLMGYIILRMVGVIVHLGGFDFHDVGAGSLGKVDLLDVVYWPLCMLEKTVWYVGRDYGVL